MSIGYFRDKSDCGLVQSNAGFSLRTFILSPNLDMLRQSMFLNSHRGHSSVLNRAELEAQVEAACVRVSIYSNIERKIAEFNNATISE